MSEAQDTLPNLPQRREKEWVTKELRILARKKHELMYGLECAALTVPQQNRMQSFVMWCLRIIHGVSLREEKRNTAIRKLAKQQRVSSVLMRKRLWFLGHLERMKDECVPKKLLVCATEHS